MIKLSTWSTLYFEFLGPFLLFFPVFTDFFKLFTCIGFILMHFSFGMCLHIGFFMYIPCVCALSFMPPLFWDILSSIWNTIARKLLNIQKRTNIVVYYDDSLQSSQQQFWWNLFIIFGGFPHKFISFIPKVDDEISDKLKLSNSFLLIEQDTKIITNHQIFKYLILFSPVFTIILFPILLFNISRNFLFQILFLLCSSHYKEQQHMIENRKALYISRLLSNFGFYVSNYLFFNFRNYNIPLSSSKKQKLKFLFDGFISLFVLLACIYCLQWNVYSHFDQDQYKPLLFVSDYLRLDQWWGMFSPNPPLYYGWIVVSYFLKYSVNY